VIESPWQTIQRLVAAAATGELIVASDAIEVHVYLLDGRLAWGTSSTAGNGFLRRLIEHHGIPNDAVREVVDECRRTRARFGETLISWGVATADQVRDALRSQITEALHATIAHPGARSLFLPRRLDYAVELTFGIDELAIEVDPAAGSSPEAAQKMVTTVLDGVPDALWIEVVERGDVLARAVRSMAPSREVQQLQVLLHDCQIDALTLRSPAHGAILGQRLPGQDGALWCMVDAGAKLGITSAVLASAVGATPTTTPAEELDGSWQEHVDPDAPMPPSVFGGAIHTTDDLIAGFALGARGGPTGVWRGGGTLDAHAAWARRLSPALELATHDMFKRPVGSLLYDVVALRAVAGAATYYGTRVPNRPLGVWLVLRPCTTQGLGWALLQTLARQVGEL